MFIASTAGARSILLALGPGELSDTRGDRLESRVSLCAIGSARLRHVGPAAAALAAERRRADLDQVDRVVTRGQVFGDADHDTGSAFIIDPDNGDNS